MNNEPFIVDAHTHLGYCSNFYMPDVTPETMIEIMDICGIKNICTSHIVGLYTHNIEFAFEETALAVQKFPGRIFAYAIYDPFLQKKSIELIDKYISVRGFVGIKIHPAMHEYPMDGKNYEPLWEYADEKKLVVLTHSWDATPQNTYPFEVVPAQEYAQPKLVDRIAGRHQGLKILLGHGGGHYYGQVQAIEMVREHDNVYVDICGEAKGFGVVEWLVKEIGSKKILYASDFSWLDPRGHIGRVLMADISTEDKERILYKNANEMFDFTV
jgi:predicted TIM-barrel fold metal-dependent hydrolase